MEFPRREKFPLPLEVVLDKQVATIKAASTAAQSSALLAVARAEVADCDSRQLVASMEVFLVQHTNESTDCLVPEYWWYDQSLMHRWCHPCDGGGCILCCG